MRTILQIMFCAKLKDLKISGECPFSMAVGNEEPADFEESNAVNVVPVSREVQGNIANILPKRKISRSKVNLHSLGESIRKLVYPEVNSCLIHLMIFCSRFLYVGLKICLISFCLQSAQREMCKADKRQLIITISNAHTICYMLYKMLFFSFSSRNCEMHCSEL